MRTNHPLITDVGSQLSIFCFASFRCPATCVSRHFPAYVPLWQLRPPTSDVSLMLLPSGPVLRLPPLALRPAICGRPRICGENLRPTSDMKVLRFSASRRVGLTPQFWPRRSPWDRTTFCDFSLKLLDHHVEQLPAGKQCSAERQWRRRLLHAQQVPPQGQFRRLRRGCGGR
jgi:hypothetical protein